jgi:hypothetical protein
MWATTLGLAPSPNPSYCPGYLPTVERPPQHALNSNWTIVRQDHGVGRAGVLAGEQWWQGGVEPPTFLFSGLRCSVRLRSAPSVACAGTSSRPLVDARERTRMRRKKRRVQGTHRSTQDFRKPMLYPLSYEGLACTFAQRAGRVVVRWLGLDASVQTVCAAPVPRAVTSCWLPPRTRRRLYGGRC